MTGRDLPRVRVVHLPQQALAALGDADLAAANRSSPVPLGEIFLDPDWRSTWRRRARQVVDDPPALDWVTGVVWDVDRELGVGRAGFHGPPDADGMVEVGYSVAPAHRRRGYARAALQELFDRAVADPRVRVVRLSIAPTNDASTGLARSSGFVRVGEQWDDEDGLELLWERLTRPPAGPG